MKIIPPEIFLKERFLRDLHKEQILGSFPCEVRWLNEYKNLICEESDIEMEKVVVKVNFLMKACLKNDNKAISEFLSEFGKLEDDVFGLDVKKIIETK